MLQFVEHDWRGCFRDEGASWDLNCHIPPIIRKHLLFVTLGPGH